MFSSKSEITKRITVFKHPDKTKNRNEKEKKEKIRARNAQECKVFLVITVGSLAPKLITKNVAIQTQIISELTGYLAAFRCTCAPVPSRRFRVPLPRPAPVVTAARIVDARGVGAAGRKLGAEDQAPSSGRRVPHQLHQFSAGICILLARITV